MVATYWPSACVFNKLYLENLLAPLRHTFPITTIFKGWYLLTPNAMGPWPVDRFCFDRLWSWSREQSRDNPHQIFSKRQTGITVLWMLHDDVIKWKYFFALLVLCGGNPPVNEGFPTQRPVKRMFNISLSAHIQTPESKQSRRRCFETPWRSLWRHCKWSQKWISQYGLSATLLVKTVYGRNLLTVCVRVQWVVSWKFIGSFTPHLSINNSFRVDICWPVLPWGHDQSSVSVWPAVTVVTCAI